MEIITKHITVGSKHVSTLLCNNSLQITCGTLYNCQMNTVGGLEEFFNYFNRRENATKLFITLYGISYKPLILVDINLITLNRILKLVNNDKSFIVNEMTFTSTNKHKRIIAVFNIKKLCTLLEKLKTI